MKQYPGPSHSWEPLGTPMAPTKFWNSCFHAVPSCLQAPQFFPINGINQESNSLSILAVIVLNLALYSEMVVVFWPHVEPPPQPPPARSFDSCDDSMSQIWSQREPKLCPLNQGGHFGVKSAKFREGQDFKLPLQLGAA